jgi:cytochrome P450
MFNTEIELPPQGNAAHARRDEPCCPVWSRDRLESSAGPEIEAPYFDEALDAWVLSRHEDVLAAFRSLGLIPAGANSGKHPESGDENERLNHERLRMREETLEALSPALLNSWRDRLVPEAEALAAGLSVESPVDLIEDYARPLCLLCASIVTGIELNEARKLQEQAKHVAAAAADPFDPVLRASGKSASAGLRPCFHAGPETLRDSGFVALSQTMIGILGNAWFALVQHPAEWSHLHRLPALTEQATEELLRYAGLVRVIFRLATEDVSLNGAFIRKGERVVLRIVAANRDPERFPDANQLDVARRSAGHLTLGAGPHSCVGASLIRMSVVAITQPLVEQFAAVRLCELPDWQGGPVYRRASALNVRLTQ